MDKDPVVFSTCRDHDTRFYRLLYASYQPGSRNERRCACMGSHDATGRHIHRDVTIHSPDCRSTDGCRAVRPRDAAQMSEADPASALSRTEDDGQYAVLRFSVAACLLCFQLPADGDLSKRSAGSRTEESYIADCPYMVSCRYFRIPARRMDLSRAGMETQNHQSHYRRAITANLLSVAHTGSIQQVPPLFSGLYFVDSFFLVAFYRTIQGRKAGLGTIKN